MIDANREGAVIVSLSFASRFIRGVHSGHRTAPGKAGSLNTVSDGLIVVSVEMHGPAGLWRWLKPTFDQAGFHLHMFVLQALSL